MRTAPGLLYVAPSESLIKRLVLANRILYDQGVVDGFGHVSARHDGADDLFLLSRSRAPALVCASDITCYGFDGEAVSPAPGSPYLERFIHAEIYRARPDVGAVVHHHSPNVIPFGVTGARLRPIFHMAGFLGSGATIFDTRDAAGDTDLLIRNPALGAGLARALGDRCCILMRGHGGTVVGSSLEQAVFRSIYAEQNAKLQQQAMAMGQVTFLTDQEAAMADASNDGQALRAWDLWVERIGPIAD